MAIAALAAGAGDAHAKSCDGIDFPDRAQVAGSTLVLNGLGLRQATAFKVNVYVAALYVAKASSDAAAILAANTPKQLVLHFVRGVSDDELTEAWEEGFAKNAKADLPKLHERIETLNGWMADMEKGQQLRFVHEPGKGIHVDVNGAAKGTIAGDDFAKAFFSIWLGAEPPNPGIKEGLLGGACD
jgi:hypothetical protein